MDTGAETLSEPRAALIRVPEVTVYFWVAKLLTTAFGEAASDYLVHTINPYLAVIGAFAVFAVAMAIQLRAGRYITWVYWLAVSMVAVFGTMAADVVHIEFGVPYIASTILFALALVAVFASWYRSERTLSIHSIDTPARERFYWAAVLATFAMGTALGDLAAYTAHLGFLSAGIVFTVVFAVPGLAYRFRALNGILAFWLSYIVTRPLGASFADWTGKARTAGGIGLGDGPVAFVLAALLVGVVGYLGHSGKDRRASAEAPVAGGSGGEGLEPSLADDAAG